MASTTKRTSGPVRRFAIASRAMTADRQTDTNPAVYVPIGHDEFVIRDRYEFLSIANDVLIAIFFTAGSVLFFFESTMVVGTWMFLLGSIDFLARPVIRLSRRIHLQRIGSATSRSEEQEEY